MNKFLRIISTLFILCLTAALSLQASTGTTDRVNRLFSPWDKPDSPGCALAVVREGKIIYERGYGMANLEHHVPITPESVFYVGSVSKQFVAMCIALLVQKGKLSLQDDIRLYLPELPAYKNPILIKHLIYHTSGLRDYLELESLIGMPFGFYHEDDVLELISRQKELNFSPGEKFLYSNTGYFLLALIVKRVSGKSLNEFAQKNIFKPLGMKKSCFHDDYRMLIPGRASGYFPAGKNKFFNFISAFDCVGSGGLYTTVRDLYLWDQNFYHKKVGGKEVLDMMHTRGKLKSGKEIDYAFALSLGQYKGLKTVSHSGALGGYRSALIRFPEERFSVICLSNLSSFTPARLCYQVADIYLASRLREEKKEKIEINFLDISREKLRARTGTFYSVENKVVYRIFMRRKHLCLETNGKSYRLGALSENEFLVINFPYSLKITFTRHREGKPWVLEVHRKGEEPIILKKGDFKPLSPDELEEYTGDFYSQELGIKYSITLKDENLWFVHKNAPKNPFLPLFKDMFKVRNLTLSFTRDKEGRISGFSLDTARVKNLKFIKIHSPGHP